MSWLDKIVPSVRGKENRGSANVPEGLWKKCPKCDAVLYRPELDKNLDVCPKCEHHMRVGGRRRLEIFLDPESRVEIEADLETIGKIDVQCNDRLQKVHLHRGRNNGRRVKGETDTESNLRCHRAHLIVLGV